MVSLEKILTADEQAEQIERAVWHQGKADETLLREMIEAHHKWTGSLRAREILDHWADSRARFAALIVTNGTSRKAEALAFGDERRLVPRGSRGRGLNRKARLAAGERHDLRRHGLLDRLPLTARDLPP